MKRKTAAAVVLIAMILLTSCSMGPKYVKPVVDTPDVYRTSAPSTPQDSGSLGDLHWFDVFKDDQLRALIKTALAQNFDLQEAVARVSAARASLGVTKSDQLPSVVGSADFTALGNSQTGPFLLSPAFRRIRNYGGILLNLLSFEVDVWGRLRNATSSARALLLASEENRKAVTATLVGDVAATYFNLLELDLELEINKRTAATRKDSLELIKKNEQGGVATLLDVRQAEELVYSAAETIPQIELEIEQTENRISLLLGNNPGPIRRGRALTEQQQPPAVPAGLPSSLLERRPDIRAAEETLIAANANIAVARAAYFPRISLTGFAGFESSQLKNLFEGSNSAWNFGPQIAQPLFTGGALKSNVRFTEARRRSALIAYEKAIRTAFKEVSDALSQQQKIREIRIQRELLVGAVRDRTRLAYIRYRQGVDTLLNALDADRTLFAAELNLAQTRRDELLALVQLYKALGGGWQ
jgi:multidrug efflux system outer membrane protein